jgi:DNA-binding transcriptional MerR regulator
MESNGNNDFVSAQELAKAASEAYNTIDYWSERGILVFKRRGRRRLYDLKGNLRRIKLTRERQDRGHSIEGILDEIRRLEL